MEENKTLEDALQPEQDVDITSVPFDQAQAMEMLQRYMGRGKSKVRLTKKKTSKTQRRAKRAIQKASRKANRGMGAGKRGRGTNSARMVKR